MVCKKTVTSHTHNQCVIILKRDQSLICGCAKQKLVTKSNHIAELVDRSDTTRQANYIGHAVVYQDNVAAWYESSLDERDQKDQYSSLLTE